MFTYTVTPLKTYWLEPANKLRRSLRRYCSNAEHECPGVYGYCNGETFLDVVAACEEHNRSGDLWPHDDPLWPKVCAGCGKPFVPGDVWQLSVRQFYVDSRSGNLVTINEAEPGAVWDCPWYHDVRGFLGPDGLSLCAKLPDGCTWHLDGRADNCTMPEDYDHKCWVRHGDPRQCNLTVDKAGHTCAAGAGSILSYKGWHGFLRAGYFVL